MAPSYLADAFGLLGGFASFLLHRSKCVLEMYLTVRHSPWRTVSRSISVASGKPSADRHQVSGFAPSRSSRRTPTNLGLKSTTGRRLFLPPTRDRKTAPLYAGGIGNSGKILMGLAVCRLFPLTPW